MSTFADYVRYYNNADVIGFVEAVDQMVAHEKLRNGLDKYRLVYLVLPKDTSLVNSMIKWIISLVLLKNISI